MTRREYLVERLVLNGRDASEQCRARALGTNDNLFESLAEALEALTDFIEHTEKRAR